MTTINKINIIPEVSEIIENDSIFTLNNKTTIGISTDILLEKSTLLKSLLAPATGYTFPQSTNDDNNIKLILEGDPIPDSRGFADESYEIIVNQNQCLLKSSTEEGIARAIQTFRQLLPHSIFSSETAVNKKWEIPGCHIHDRPTFKWRGMHLDVCRHFMTKDDVLKFIDMLALYKFNRFHFHLTEDQGWRIEIKKYPKLTEVGAYRESTLIGHLEDKPKKYIDEKHGGFYTQEEIKEIVAYAKVREIIIIPEIDMPGHMQAAISAYPELGCAEMKLKPLCHWGISQHILNVEDSTINFMKDVLDEIIDLFPGDYIHIGGDEAPKYEWEETRRIQDRIIELGVKNEDELQSWFITQVSKHIQSRGRKVIGWDEIFEGGLADGAAVMSWQSEAGGMEAAALGHDVVMTPHSHVYFDHYQGDKDSEPVTIGGFTPLDKVYDYKVIPEDMPEHQHSLVMGSQGQLWTEYMKDFNHVEYMMFPRACALAENLWSLNENKDYDSFIKKLKHHLIILDNLHINYRKLSK